MNPARGAILYRLCATWIALTALACSKQPDAASKAPRTLTPAQRDSAIAASKLPGAGVVGKALEAADSAAARATEPVPEPGR